MVSKTSKKKNLG